MCWAAGCGTKGWDDGRWVGNTLTQMAAIQVAPAQQRRIWPTPVFRGVAQLIFGKSCAAKTNFEHVNTKNRADCVLWLSAAHPRGNIGTNGPNDDRLDFVRLTSQSTPRPRWLRPTTNIRPVRFSAHNYPIKHFDPLAVDLAAPSGHAPTSIRLPTVQPERHSARRCSWLGCLFHAAAVTRPSCLCYLRDSPRLLPCDCGAEARGQRLRTAHRCAGNRSPHSEHERGQRGCAPAALQRYVHTSHATWCACICAWWGCTWFTAIARETAV